MAKTPVKKELLNQSKISSEFAHRLSELEPHQVVRVLVLLDFKNNTERLCDSQKFPDKNISVVEHISNLEKQALDHIRKIIQDNDGKQLAEHFSLLGSIPIEITAAGVYELATLDAVKAVIEDQQIYPIDN
jgi:hypothetical protein